MMDFNIRVAIAVSRSQSPMLEEFFDHGDPGHIRVESGRSAPPKVLRRTSQGF
jgi:hypothetical protein